MTGDLRTFVEGLLLVIAALLPIVNPFGGAPVFLAMTADCTAALRATLAQKIAVNAFVLLLASLFVGTYVLEFFGLSVTVVQVAGGIVVCANAWELLRAETAAPIIPATTPAAREIASRAFYPLTLPVSIDAGVIAVAITLGAHHQQTIAGEAIQIVAALLGSAAIAASLLLAYRYAGRVSGWIGNKGMEIMLRLSALLVLSIGVQIIWNGAKSLLAEINIT